MTSHQPTEPARRRLRLPSVRTLVVVTLLLAIGSIYFGVILPYQRQRAAIERIAATLGGSVNLEQTGPRWIRDLIGDWNMIGFDRVTYVSLACTDTTDDDLHHLATELPNLGTLALVDTKITDDGLSALAGFTQMRHLYLGWTDLTDEGVQQLTRLRMLNDIYIYKTGITDAGVLKLRQHLPGCVIHRDPLDNCFLPLPESHAGVIEYHISNNVIEIGCPLDDEIQLPK